MAISTNTEALIGIYQDSIKQNTEAISQVDATEVGFSYDLPDGTKFKLYGIQETLGYFAEPIKKIDARIVALNDQIVGLQNTILDVGQTANTCGCGGSVGFGTTGVPYFIAINTTTVYQDTIPYRGYTYSSPNPWAATNGTLTLVNAGIGTEDLVSQSSIGVYYGDVGVARTTLPVCPGVTDCAGYATSITNLTNQITPLQSERNALIVKANYLKKERIRYEIRQYGFNRQKEELNAEIGISSSIISFLEDPANEEWL